MSELRAILAEVLKLPKERVISDRQLIGHTQLDFFVVVERLFSKKIGNTNKTYNEKELKEVLTTTLNSTVQVSAYGKNANLLIEKLRTIIRSSFFQAKLNRMKVGLINVSDVRNISSEFVANYEERSSIDLILSHENVVIVDIKVMSGAKVTTETKSTTNEQIILNPKYKGK